MTVDIHFSAETNATWTLFVETIVMLGNMRRVNYHNTCMLSQKKQRGGC